MVQLFSFNQIFTFDTHPMATTKHTVQISEVTSWKLGFVPVTLP